MLLIGSQAPYEKSSKKLLEEIKEVKENNGKVVQVFLRDMTTTSKKARKEVSEKDQEDIKRYVSKNELKVFVHGSYLLSFCRVPPGLLRIKWAYDILAEDMELASNMNFEGVVIHMCSRNAVDEKWKSFSLSEEETEKRMIDHIKYFFSKYKFKTKLLLENSSSEGNKIGGDLKSFGNVYKPLKKLYKNRIGICLDTCHAFVSGYPINTISGMKNFFNDFKKYVGNYSDIALIHLNDAEAPLGSKKDRHIGIGKGYIFKSKEGEEALKYLIAFASENSIPMCLETHANYKEEIELIYKIFQKEQIGGVYKKGNIYKEEIIEILKEFEEIHRSLGNVREATQYGKAIASLKNSDIKMVKSGDELLILPYIGKGIVGKINEFIKTGRIKLLEEFKKDKKVKAYIELTKVFDIGPKKAQQLIKKGIFSVKQLNNSNLTKSQQIGLKYYDDLQKKIPRKESEKVRDIIQKETKFPVLLAGSYRTGKKESGDIDIIIISKENILKNVVEKLSQKNIIIDSLQGDLIPKNTQTIYIGIIKVDKIARHIDIHIVPPENAPFYMLYFGSGERFSRLIRQYAKERGYKLSDKGLFKNGKKIGINNEEDIFKELGLKYIRPENREKIIEL